MTRRLKSRHIWRYPALGDGGESTRAYTVFRGHIDIVGLGGFDLKYSRSNVKF